MKGWARLTIAAALALISVPARAGLQELTEAAKKEGEVTWYVAHYTSDGAEDLGRGFNETYGIKVNVVRTTAQVAYQRLLQDIRQKRATCDVFSSTDVGHYVRLKAEANFEKYIPENAQMILAEFRNFDPEGFYHATSAGLVLLTYNEREVRANDAPGRWTDILDIKWKGKVAVGHPAFSGYAGTWALAMRKHYGWRFFEKLEKNQPLVGRSINDAIPALNAGRRQVAAGAQGATLTSASHGAPLAITYPSDGSVLIVAPSAIMKEAKHPNAARLFMEYLYSVQAAKITARHFGIPLRPEIPVPPGARPVNEVKTIRLTVEEISEGIPEVIEQWRDTFGN
jgi:iron(III) transport system substrate-binding protein